MADRERRSNRSTGTDRVSKPSLDTGQDCDVNLHACKSAEKGITHRRQGGKGQKMATSSSMPSPSPSPDENDLPASRKATRLLNTGKQCLMKDSGPRPKSGTKNTCTRLRTGTSLNGNPVMSPTHNTTFSHNALPFRERPSSKVSKKKNQQKRYTRHSHQIPGAASRPQVNQGIIQINGCQNLQIGDCNQMFISHSYHNNIINAPNSFESKDSPSSESSSDSN